jgi:phage shock protein PspC (stress-responsive transcriptional regulator)
MNSTTEQTPQPEQPEQPQGPRRLYRSRSDRVLGGVAGGLGRYFNVDPIIFRIAAVVLTFVGGAGALLYLAMLLLVPNEPVAGGGPEDPTQPLVAPDDTRNRGLVIAGVVLLLLVSWPLVLGGGAAIAAILIPLAFLVAIGVVAWWLVSGEGPSGDARDIARRAALGIGVVILCWFIAFGGAWAAAAGGEAVVAAIVITAGLAVLAGAFLKPVRWLILPAVVLALSAGTVSAAGIDIDGGYGERHYRPGTVAELQDLYKIGVGELVVDLRGVDLPAGDTPIAMDVGVGHAQLIVPRNVCVASEAQVGMGAVTVLGRDNGGVDFDWADQRSAPADTSRVVVDADVGVGHFEVDDEATLDFDDFDRDDFFSPDANRACEGG